MAYSVLISSERQQICAIHPSSGGTWLNQVAKDSRDRITDQVECQAKWAGMVQLIEVLALLQFQANARERAS